MKNSDKDILKEAGKLKEMPFSTPEGYFDSLKKNLKAIPLQQSAPAKVIQWKRTTRFAAAAAATAAILIVGSIIFEKPQQYDFYEDEDYIAYSEDMTNTIFMDYELYAEADELTIDDIIEYLIYTGTELEDIEHY